LGRLDVCHVATFNVAHDLSRSVVGSAGHQPRQTATRLSFGGTVRGDAGPRPHPTPATGAPVVGDLDLTYEATELPAGPGLTLLVYTAEPASPTQDALTLLASWAATLDQVDQKKWHATDEV
jgi:MmyB-like transcription regulator ligand binding domain